MTPFLGREYSFRWKKDKSDVFPHGSGKKNKGRPLTRVPDQLNMSLFHRKPQIYVARYLSGEPTEVSERRARHPQIT
jgi:hypothetical protein